MSNPVYRLEVDLSGAKDGPWFLRLARKMPGYRVSKEDGLEIHVVETKSVANLEGLYEIIRSWKSWAFYVDGSPATRRALSELIAGRKKSTVQNIKPKRAVVHKLTAEEKRHQKCANRILDGMTPDEFKQLNITRDDMRNGILDYLKSGEADPEPEE